MVEPDDVETASARLASSSDVIDRVHEKAIRVLGQIPRGHCLLDLYALAGRRVPAPEQEPAAFPRAISLCVRHERVETLPGERGAHTASTTIAMPMPPPMQSDATP